MTSPKSQVLQGTLDLMVLKTVATMGAMHGWGVARRIQQVSQNTLQLTQGTIYAALSPPRTARVDCCGVGHLR